MGELVGDPLHVIRLHSGVVPNDVEGSRRHGALTNRLRHQEEVVPEVKERYYLRNFDRSSNDLII